MRTTTRCFALAIATLTSCFLTRPEAEAAPSGDHAAFGHGPLSDGIMDGAEQVISLH